MSLSIRAASIDDAAALADIYNYYIVNTVVTFEIDSITAADMASRIQQSIDASQPWLVADDGAAIVGYAYTSTWKGRAAYRLTAESTVYIHNDSVGKGVGGRLYAALIEKARKREFHSLLGGIALPNDRSMRLHERLGFKKVGQLEAVGFKQDRWVDVGYWQLML